MQIYRDLFFNNVLSFLRGCFPVTAAVLGDDRWRLMIRDYYRDHRSETPLFPEMSNEFLNYLGEERADAEHGDPEPDPPFLYELAHYEWVEAGLKLAPDEPPDPTIDAAGNLLDGIPVVSALAWGLSYAWEVDRIGPEQQPDQPLQQPAHYLVYRAANDDVVFSRLNLVSARLLELIDCQQAPSGRRSLEQIAAELGHEDASRVVESGLTILERWRDIGVIKGVRTTD